MKEKKIFKVIIAGGRDFNDYKLLKEKCLKILSKKLKKNKVEIVTGGAIGADTLGEQFANELGLQSYCYYPDWRKNGKAAGMIRNNIMAQYSHALIAFWDGESHGTKHMIDTMQKMKKPYRVIRYTKGSD